MNPDDKNISREPLIGLSTFHIWQAIPVFIILMGLTSGISFDRKQMYTIRQFYSIKFLMERCWRILFTFLIIFFISLLYGISHGKDINWFMLEK